MSAVSKKYINKRTDKKILGLKNKLIRDYVIEKLKIGWSPVLRRGFWELDWPPRARSRRSETPDAPPHEAVATRRRPRVRPSPAPWRRPVSPTSLRPTPRSGTSRARPTWTTSPEPASSARSS